MRIKPERVTRRFSSQGGGVKILEIVRSLAAGGMETQLVSLMDRLDPSQYQFEVCCLHQAGVNASRLGGRIPIHVLDKSDGFQWGTVKKLKVLLHRGFDVVHTHNLGSLIYAALATHGGLSSAIFHGEHSQLAPDELNWKRWWQRKLLYRCCAAVHTVSNGQREELVKSGIRHRRMVALVNGVDTHHYQPLTQGETRAELRQRLGNWDMNDLVIGIAGRFGDFKRHMDLIAAFEKVIQLHPNARLVMLGDGGPMKATVLQRMMSSAASGRMQWVGYQTDPLPYYQAMDVLAVPSSNEGLSNVTLEAMSAGLPVLSNDICGARELLLGDRGGWARDLGTIERLTHYLNQMLSLPKLQRLELGVRGRERVRFHYSSQTMSANYSAWISACAGRSAFPGSLSD